MPIEFWNCIQGDWRNIRSINMSTSDFLHLEEAVSIAIKLRTHGIKRQKNDHPYSV
jgi:hypothetical protein